MRQLFLSEREDNRAVRSIHNVSSIQEGSPAERFVIDLVNDMLSFCTEVLLRQKQLFQQIRKFHGDEVGP